MVFTITKVRAGVKSVGDEYLGEKAQGQFVLVDVKVKNVGDEAVTLWGFEHKLIDGKGSEYSPNETAGIYVSEANALAEGDNPGNTAKGTIVFDMPMGAKPVEAQLPGGTLKAPPCSTSRANGPNRSWRLGSRRKLAFEDPDPSLGPPPQQTKSKHRRAKATSADAGWTRV